MKPDGEPYLEPHHLRRLSDGGPDHPAHVISLCPNCHRRVHFGRDATEYNQSLVTRMRAIEPDFR
ncbi:HNH endonuclease signature motif containing protein [Martelella sp. HB161492]|uniref:HNH endonuclease signature motif containing protein n=1 Tax=Martelella sp. HB161492 TaxID=2720726 RepID=UPI0032B11D70